MTVGEPRPTPFRPSFNKFRMSGKELAGNVDKPPPIFPLILNLLKDGQPPPYFRVRRMVFLQVAVQVRLCRAWYL